MMFGGEHHCDHGMRKSIRACVKSPLQFSPLISGQKRVIGSKDIHVVEGDADLTRLVRVPGGRSTPSAGTAILRGADKIPSKARRLVAERSNAAWRTLARSPRNFSASGAPVARSLAP
jgi:hypothetical protein